MSPQPSIYVIRPKDTPGESLHIGPVIGIYPPPDVPVKVGEQLIDRWHLKSAEGNTFHVFAGRGHPNDYKWIVKDKALFVSAVREPDSFRFESAGHGLFTIGIPNENLLLTLGEETPQLTFRPANGSSAQHFELIQIPRD